jgi:UDPglucose--hexose-1-phosphate uridylyltransferase
MGLAVLPARLLGEMDLLEKTIGAGIDPGTVDGLASHVAWAHEIVARHPELAADRVDAVSAATLHAIIQEEIGLVFAQVLEHCAVFANDDEGARAFARFLDCVRSGL